MAESVCYLIRAVPGPAVSDRAVPDCEVFDQAAPDCDVSDQENGWREAVEMALTCAAFGLATTVWLDAAPLAQLARRRDGEALIAELTAFGVRCVAAAENLPAGLSGVEALEADALRALRAGETPLVVL